MIDPMLEDKGLRDSQGEELTEEMNERFLGALHIYVNNFYASIGRSGEVIQKRFKQKVLEENLYGATINRISDNVDDLSGVTILELGSGTGGLSVALARNGAKVYAIEPSFHGIIVSIERSKKYKDVRTFFCRGVGEALPFKNDFFDVIISSAVLEHVQDLEKVVEEIFRTLKPHGVIYQEIPNYLFPFEGHYKILWFPLLPKRIGKLYIRFRRMNPDFLDHINYTTPQEMFTLFSDKGFRELRNLYLEELYKKIEHPENFSNGGMKILGKIIRQMGLEGLFKSVVKRTHFYPVIYLLGKKERISR
ncbi:MAG: methyltransferase domain-containing protein [Candidatus Hodarchaeales archaeon]|jgi:2-polyprenyl-3-methyl-5-hydroxy-6-metoxy-1,4-benzoquinol methylase